VYHQQFLIVDEFQSFLKEDFKVTLLPFLIDFKTVTKQANLLNSLDTVLELGELLTKILIRLQE